MPIKTLGQQVKIHPKSNKSESLLVYRTSTENRLDLAGESSTNQSTMGRGLDDVVTCQLSKLVVVDVKLN